MGAFQALLNAGEDPDRIRSLIAEGKEDLVRGASEAIGALRELAELQGMQGPMDLSQLRQLPEEFVRSAVEAKRVNRKKIIQLLQVAIGETIQHMQDSGRRQHPDDFKKLGKDDVKAAVQIRYPALAPFVGERATWSKNLREAGFSEIPQGRGTRLRAEDL